MREELKKTINPQTVDKNSTRVEELKNELQQRVTVRTELTKEEKEARFIDLQKRVEETLTAVSGMISKAVTAKEKGENLLKKLEKQNIKNIKKLKNAKKKYLDPIIGNENMV